MVTGRDDYDSIHRAFEIGATDFVAKPINVFLISYRIKYILRANNLYLELQLSKIKLASAKAVADFVTWEWCLEDDRLLWGREMCAMCGLEPEAAPASFSDFIALLPISEQQVARRIIEESLAQGKKFILEHRLRVTPERELYVRQEGAIINNALNVSVKVVFTCRDITEIRETEKKIKFMAYYDRLTGLPNRMLFGEHLGKALKKAGRTASFVAVLYVDIYKFRLINSTFGRESGDMILKEVGRWCRWSIISICGWWLRGWRKRGHLDYLYCLKCDIVQGHLISKPIPAVEVAEFLCGWQITDTVGEIPDSLAEEGGRNTDSRLS